MTTTTTTFDRTATRFLESLSRTGHVQDAIKASGISSAGMYKRRSADPEFARAWDAALQEHRDYLELTQRHVHGKVGEVSKMLARAAAELANPDLDPCDRATLEAKVRHLSARVAELKEQTDTKAQRERNLRIYRAADKLQKVLDQRDRAAVRFDDALKAAEPAWKEVLRLQAEAETLARQAQTKLPSTNLDLAIEASLHYQSPVLAKQLGVRRPSNRAQAAMASYMRRSAP